MLRNHGELSFAWAMTGVEGFLTLDLDDQYPLDRQEAPGLMRGKLKGAVKYRQPDSWVSMLRASTVAGPGRFGLADI
jgi:hypothetical protein